MLDPVPRRFTVCTHLFLPRCHRPSPSKEWVGFPHFVPRITTSRRSVFRGCRYSLMFRPPSLLSPQIVPTAAATTAEQPGILRPGLSCFVTSTRTGYANRLTQAIDGTGTFTLSDSQPCRLLTLLRRHYPASTLIQGSPPLSGASVLSASRLEPLVPFPLASPARFSRSIQEPSRASRRLHAGCRLGSLRTSPKLIPKEDAMGRRRGYCIHRR